MTFEQFRGARRYCEDLGAAISDARWEGEPAAKGYLYLDAALYIEEVLPHWPEAGKAAGKWRLLIGCNGQITNDFEALERNLYNYAMSEGCFDDKGERADDQPQVPPKGLDKFCASLLGNGQAFGPTPAA